MIILLTVNYVSNSILYYRVFEFFQNQLNKDRLVGGRRMIILVCVDSMISRINTDLKELPPHRLYEIQTPLEDCILKKSYSKNFI